MLCAACGHLGGQKIRQTVRKMLKRESKCVKNFLCQPPRAKLTLQGKAELFGIKKLKASRPLFAQVHLYRVLSKIITKFGCKNQICFYWSWIRNYSGAILLNFIFLVLNPDPLKVVPD